MYYDQTNPNEVDGYGRPLSDASRYSDYRTTQTAQPGTLPEPVSIFHKMKIFLVPRIFTYYFVADGCR